MPADKKAEDAQIIEKQFSSAIIDSIPGVFYVLDANGNFVRDNRYHQVVLGYSGEEILKMNALDTIAEEDRDLIAQKIRDVFEKGFTIVSAHILTRDGKKIPYLFTGYPTEMEGKPYLVGMGVDISERVKAEQEVLKAYRQLSAAEEKLRSQYEELKNNQALLKQSEQDYKSILFNIQDGFYRSDMDEKLVMISPSGAKILGYGSPEEVLGSNISEKFYAHPKDRHELIKLLEKNGLIENYEIKIKRKDGSIRTVSLNSHYYYDRTGKPAGIEGVFQDITRRKQAEEALKASENLYRAIFNNTGAATTIIAQDTTIRLANSGWEKLTGLPKELQENRMKWPSFFEQEEAERLIRYHYERRKDPSLAPKQYECKLIDVRREAHYCIAQVDMIHGTTDSVVSLVDITDRKRAEEELQDAKNQAELFLDLMGHDISNMNQIGVGYLEIALETMQLDETTAELISKPLETLYDSSRLIADVNKLQRITTCEIKLEKTDVCEKLTDAIDAYKGRLGARTTINASRCSPCQVMANDMISDAFSNIVWDCIKTATGSSVINISMSRQSKDSKPQCIILIDNHGTGLSEEQKTRLFERPGKGMKRTGGRGIGLYLAKSIIDRFKGTLKVEDLEPGDYTRGTRFIIELPACE
jgi:PAS domain S-box-containing protein